MVISPYFFESERYIVSLWYYFTNSTLSMKDIFNISNFITPFGNNILLNNLANLIQQETVEDTNILYENFIKNIYTTLINELLNDILSANDNSNLIQMILLICFILFLFGAYFLFWLPFINKLMNDNIETTNLLLFIPLKLIKKTNLLVQEIEDKLK